MHYITYDMGDYWLSFLFMDGSTEPHRACKCNVGSSYEDIRFYLLNNPSFKRAVLVWYTDAIINGQTF